MCVLHPKPATENDSKPATHNDPKSATDSNRKTATHNDMNPPRWWVHQAITIPLMSEWRLAMAYGRGLRNAIDLSLLIVMSENLPGIMRLESEDQLV
jgi:hypothetical protein